MRHLRLAGLSIALAIVLLGPQPAAGQAADGSSLPRTPDGRPDLQGVWDFRTITPMERPPELAGKTVLTDEEAASFELAENRRLNRDLIDPEKGGAFYPPESEGGVVPYNEFWYDRGNTIIGERRTSLIVDPPDGRIPPLTPDGQRRANDQAAARDRPAYGPEDRGVGERCILGFNAGPPMIPSAYNNNFQLFQTPEYVVILNEMVHSARIVPMDGQPHLSPSIRQLSGDSRGRWEGDTLVVESTNFQGTTSFDGSTKDLHLVERFTRGDGDTLRYEFTATDPTTWTGSWTASIPMPRAEAPMFEYACHEGNIGMEGILGGARADDKAAAEGRR